MVGTKEHRVLEADFPTRQANKVYHIITLEEQQELVKSVLNYEDTDMNSSQDLEAFMGLLVPSDSLWDLVMSEIKELVDFEGYDKDDQGWIDGPREGVSLTNESGKSPDESILTTAETNDKVAQDTGKEALIDDKPFGFTDVRMSEVHSPPKVDDS